MSTFTYVDESNMTREEIIDKIIEDRAAGLKTYSLEKKLRLKDNISDKAAKDYYAQLNRYIQSEVAGKLEEA